MGTSRERGRQFRVLGRWFRSSRSGRRSGGRRHRPEPAPWRTAYSADAFEQLPGGSDGDSRSPSPPSTPIRRRCCQPSRRVHEPAPPPAGGPSSRPSPPAWLYGLVVFAAAWLVFWTQPLAVRGVLPVLGGSPAVWNTAMVFFQSALPLGSHPSCHTPIVAGSRPHHLDRYLDRQMSALAPTTYPTTTLSPTIPILPHQR